MSNEKDENKISSPYYLLHQIFVSEKLFYLSVKFSLGVDYEIRHLSRRKFPLNVEVFRPILIII